MDSKVCPHCRQPKPAERFDRRPDGRLQSWCKRCMNAANSDRMEARMRRGMCKYGEHPRGADGTPTMCRRHADHLTRLGRKYRAELKT